MLEQLAIKKLSSDVGAVTAVCIKHLYGCGWERYVHQFINTGERTEVYFHTPNHSMIWCISKANVS